jgi:hypothetical protein
MEKPLYEQLKESEQHQLMEFCKKTGHSPSQIIRAGVKFILDNEDDEDVIEGLMEVVSN